MSDENRDLIVLGSGPGGYTAAIRAAQLGRKVTIVERESLGGVCLNWGCIPTKALLTSASLLQQIKHSSQLGFSIESLRVDFPKIVERSRAVAERLSAGVKYLMKKNQIEVVWGRGKLMGGRRLVVADAEGYSRTFSYSDLIIAVGASPRLLPGVKPDGEVIHTSRTILEFKRLPQKMLIIGAGAIGVEFAYFFHCLGTKITLVEMLDRVLPLEDRELSGELEKIFRKQGMLIMTGTQVENLRQTGKVVSATLKSNNSEEKWSGDCCLVAIGVTPNTAEIGLEKEGIRIEKRFIATGNDMACNIPHHFAIGDAAGPPLLAHKASHEGVLAAEAACRLTPHALCRDNIPSCTYCRPQVASVGMTEEAVKQAGLKYRTGKIPFSAIGKALAAGEAEGFIKVIVSEDTGEILGTHIIHPEAVELISAATLIRSHEGIAQSVLDTIFPHPTLSEGLFEAVALAQGRPLNF